MEKGRQNMSLVPRKYNGEGVGRGKLWEKGQNGAKKTAYTIGKRQLGKVKKGAGAPEKNGSACHVEGHL